LTWDTNTFDTKDSHAARFMRGAAEIATMLAGAPAMINVITDVLHCCRQRGARVFVIGVGGSAANASHLVNDLRKLCGIEAYSPTDNVSELTARINDDGFNDAFVSWLTTSRFSAADVLFVLSVGGGSRTAKVSECISNAVLYAWRIGAVVTGIVGKYDGDAVKYGDGKVVVVPEIEKSLVTPYSEAFQALIWHCVVSDPSLQRTSTKW